MFTDDVEALAICKQYAGIPRTDISWDRSLQVMLVASASRGTPIYYRPYIVAAFQIWSRAATSRGQLISADGVKWLSPEEIQTAIAGLLATQEALDFGIDDIPNGWSVAVKRPLLCGCDKLTDTVGTPRLGAMIAW